MNYTSVPPEPPIGLPVRKASPQPWDLDAVRSHFVHPPPEARPLVIWQWNGGILSKEGMTKDLEAMADRGVGGVMVMQMPDQAPYPQQWEFKNYPDRCSVLSEEWFGIVNHAVGEADRLGLTFSMFLCPGWSHAGGPWVPPERSLKVLTSKTVEVEGPGPFTGIIPKPLRHVPTKGGNQVPEWFREQEHDRELFPEPPDFFSDVGVLAVPVSNPNGVIGFSGIIDLSDRIREDGMLKWDVPDGKWNVMRFGVVSHNGLNHPAPFEASGLESDRMDPEAVRIVFEGMIGRIVREARAKGYTSFTSFETDSYEGGVQDYSLDFREQFEERRGYDCLTWLPAWIDKDLVIDSQQLTWRFRCDMTRTLSELLAERFAGTLKKLADEHGIGWMTEPYFRLAIDWHMQSAQTGLPGSEFWMGKSFHLIGPAPDTAALYGLQVVWAESFTAESFDSAWRNHPGVLKPWADAAFCRGINHIYMHGFAHNPFGDHLQPGFTMGYWGTQFSRHLTWWPESLPWHTYLARTQYLLQQGRPVNDVLVYPPRSEALPRKQAHAGAFRQVTVDDTALMERIWVREDGRLEVKGGGEFAAITLSPDMPMEPGKLRRIRDLVRHGATLIGEAPPRRSASLQNFPESDHEVCVLIDEMWGPDGKGEFNERRVGEGRVLDTANLVGALDRVANGPDLQFTDLSGRGDVCLTGKEPWIKAGEVEQFEIPPVQVNAKTDAAFSYMDFTHRRAGDVDIYFVVNVGKKSVELIADFRVDDRVPEAWDPLTGTQCELENWRRKDGRTQVPMRFEAEQSFFVVFRNAVENDSEGSLNFRGPVPETVLELAGSWRVCFDPVRGGPNTIVFDQLQDWSQHEEKGVKFYSGTACYHKHFDLEGDTGPELYLDLGKVHDLARVILNGVDLGVVWTSPWRVQLPNSLLRGKGNELSIEVTNTWVNRMIGDEHEPEDVELIAWDPETRKGSYDVKVGSRGLKDFPDWVVNNCPRPSSGRYTFVTWRFYDRNAPLLPAGLLGPVKVVGLTDVEPGQGTDQGNRL